MKKCSLLLAIALILTAPRIVPVFAQNTGGNHCCNTDDHQSGQEKYGNSTHGEGCPCDTDRTRGQAGANHNERGDNANAGASGDKGGNVNQGGNRQDRDREGPHAGSK